MPEIRQGMFFMKNEVLLGILRQREKRAGIYWNGVKTENLGDVAQLVGRVFIVERAETFLSAEGFDVLYVVYLTEIEDYEHTPSIN